MTKVTWTILGLFLLGNALFVLPVNISSKKITTEYIVNYKKDSFLLQAAFPDTVIKLELNMPGKYHVWEAELNKSKAKADSYPVLHVNTFLLNDVGFTPLAFPFYKSVNFNAQIVFQSNIINADDLEADSVALIGNIVVQGKLRVIGICNPLKAKELVEKELVAILNKEIRKIEADINQHLRVTFPVEEEPVRPLTATKRRPAIKSKSPAKPKSNVKKSVIKSAPKKK
jgi:hypothetical protein